MAAGGGQLRGSDGRYVVGAEKFAAQHRRRVNQTRVGGKFGVSRDEWFIQQVEQAVGLTMYQRTWLATSFVRDKVVRNISVPVRRVKRGRGRWYTERSRPGEFPRVETAVLMRSIFAEVREVSRGVYEGHVGTPVWYGAHLELRMDRSFLVRTLNEEASKIRRIMTSRG